MLSTNKIRKAGDAWQRAEHGSGEEIERGSELMDLANAAADEIDRLRARLKAMRAKDKARRLSDAGDRRDWDACDAIEAGRPDSEREQAATVRHVWGVCEDVEAP